MHKVIKRSGLLWMLQRMLIMTKTLFEHYLHEHEHIRIEPTVFPRAPPIGLITI